MGFLKFLEGIRNPFFDFIFSAITYLGDETAFMAVAILIFWCVSKKDGYYILSVGLIGTVINQFLKLAFRIPRPWVKDPSFTIVESAREAATGYSFPSGHTQNSVGTFGAIAFLYKKKWVRITAIVLCVLVPFSRMYLGVHTPLDVFVSVGIALVLIFALKPLFDYLVKKPFGMYIFLSSMIVLSLGLLIFILVFPFPADLDPHNYESGLKNACTLLGATCGMLIAYPIEEKFIRFETEGKWYSQLIKVALGLGIVLGLKAGLKVLLSLFLPAMVERVIRYAIIVLFAVCVWPLAFKFIRRLENVKKNCCK
ncbi:MAG: phosphatase PAP2 family protein [Clostridia bacterium]|nr:phosphatase PAP2 family protein [Clostridia bacterium]